MMSVVNEIDGPIITFHGDRNQASKFPDGRKVATFLSKTYGSFATSARPASQRQESLGFSQQMTRKGYKPTVTKLNLKISATYN